jgi:hypothetical protein
VEVLGHQELEIGINKNHYTDLNITVRHTLSHPPPPIVRGGFNRLTIHAPGQAFYRIKYKSTYLEQRLETDRLAGRSYDVT